jgi:predicted ATPase
MSCPWGSSNGDDVDHEYNGASHDEESTPPEPPPLAVDVDPPFRCSCRASSSSGSSDDADDGDDNDTHGKHTGSYRATLRSGDREGSLRSNHRARGDDDQDYQSAGTGTKPLKSSSPGSCSSNIPLDHPNNKLCDRERESEQLRRVFDRCCGCGSTLDRAGDDCHAAQQSLLLSPSSSPPTPSYRGELALVTGPSGCGKTCLVKSVFREALRRRRRRRREVGPPKAEEAGVVAPRDEGGDGTRDADPGSGGSSEGPTDDPRGIMICGKFDQLERREQYYAIVQALTEYALIVSRESSPSQLHSVRKVLAPHREAVQIVAELVPELQTLLYFDDDDDPILEPSPPHAAVKPPPGAQAPASSAPEGRTLARERLQLGLRRFFSATCSPDHPVVLFLDDLQWAEPASLDLLASLFTDRIPGLVLVGACRDNEVDPASYLCVILRELEARHVTITQVIVSNVGQSALASALAESFEIVDKAEALARILYERTAGNVFFVTQLVHFLVSEGVLYKQKGSRLWTFDSDLRVREAVRAAATDVVSLLANVIRKQDREVQDTLMVASCLGAEFSELALRTAVAFDVEGSLQVAQKMALLKRSSHDRQTWRFVHDRIQESAYSLIPLHEREQIHLEIGRKLWSSMSEADLDAHAHVVVKQLRLGVRLMTNPAERELLSALLLRAGEMAATASAHVTAQEYVSLGIELLDTRHWRDQYSLSLALFNAASEIEYCLANFERMDALVEVIMENARGTKDKIRAQTARIYSLGSRNQLEKAIDVGLETLKNFLGETIPSRPSAVSIVVELWKTKRLLRQHSDASIMSLPAMDEFKTLSSIRIMCLLLMYGVLGRPNLTPIVAMRIVQLSLRHGLCGMSGTGFAFYGMILTQFFNDVETGIRYSTVALRIVERFDAME